MGELDQQNQALRDELDQLRSNSVVPPPQPEVPLPAPDSASNDTVLKQIRKKYVGATATATPKFSLESDIPKKGDIVLAKKGGDGGIFAKFGKNQWGIITGVSLNIRYNMR